MKKIISYSSKFLLLWFAVPLAYSQVNTVRIIPPLNSELSSINAKAILARQISDRSNVKIVDDDTAELNITLLVEKKDSPESYSIIENGDTSLKIIGSDERGLLYGIGKFLRTSSFDQDGFSASEWEGSSSPNGKVRGMYFASHFNNFYEAAPIQEVLNYVEELVLWGVNYLVFTYPVWQFEGMDDVKAKNMASRLNQIMSAAKSNGMKVGLIQVPNGGFKTTPKEFLNVPVPDALGRRGNFGVNLDPANPQAHALLLKQAKEQLELFKSVGLDAIIFWPYDEGGCGCDDCWPWGARGFPKLSKEISSLAREKYPEIEIVLSTWVFDTPEAGEWKGLSEFLQSDQSWADYIMADSHEDYPPYPLDIEVPGGLPLLNFPEISMWGQSPWGGYGANPLANRLQGLWDQTDNKLSGGFPYSEGIYEDINKVICTQLYWDRSRSTSSIVKEYIAYEFSPKVVDEVAKVFEIFEANHSRKKIDSNALEAFRLVKQADRKLTPQIRKSWRWRIVYLRAVIDKELYLKKELKGEVLKKAFEELTEIYHAGNSHDMPIHPPVIE
tara:strand:- start:1019 stop:2686 length:1668 start_codon:yes stop_codon:yes gene_type:complete